MERIEVCDKCGVPLMVSGELSWDDNGVISSKSSPRHRWVFFESENIDPLFRGLEELIGVPIEHIVIESRRREARKYLERVFPPEVREILKYKGEASAGGGEPLTQEEKETKKATAKAVTVSVHDVARIFGYGDLVPGELWEQDHDFPWRSTLVGHPYSLLFNTAESLGSCEAFEGIDLWVEYEEVGEDKYRFTSYVAEHPIELKGRLKRKRYDFKPGEIHYECCPQCGVPNHIGRYIWDLDNGTITDPDTGRRMAIFGPMSLDSILDDLEDELGEAIPELVIESGRRYIRSAWSTDEWRRRAPDFQRMIALRGLGNLTLFEGDREHLTLILQNACLHLSMVGIIQALVEMAYRVDSSANEWDLSEDGDLTVTIKIQR